MKSSMMAAKSELCTWTEWSEWESLESYRESSSMSLSSEVMAWTTKGPSGEGGCGGLRKSIMEEGSGIGRSVVAAMRRGAMKGSGSRCGSGVARGRVGKGSPGADVGWRGRVGPGCAGAVAFRYMKAVKEGVAKPEEVVEVGVSSGGAEEAQEVLVGAPNL